MKTANCIAAAAAAALTFVLAANVSAQAGHSKINAAIMFSGGENSTCVLGNINDAWVVTVSTVGGKPISEYISSAGPSCVVLPLSLALGTQINVTGVLQDTDSIPGGSASPNIASIMESCFNVEGFSVGLASNSGSEFNPQDPSNIINSQNYGFLWYDSDSNIKPGPYSYTVQGCASDNCPLQVASYNTDDPTNMTLCTVLAPLSDKRGCN